MAPELTDEERKAIASFKRLAKRWPSTLWVYASGDELSVRRTKEDGSRADEYLGDDEESYEVDRIDLPNDGGRDGP